MTTDQAAAEPTDRPLLPPDPEEAGMGPLRWVITGIALVLLVVGAWRAYEWFTADVERRRAVAVGAAPHPQATVAPTAPRGEPGSDQPGRTVTSPMPAPVNAPVGPAVTGIEGVNKCVVDGHVTYTNEACPAGASAPVPAPAEVGADPNGVAGSVGEAPVVVARPSVFSEAGDPSQQTALCNYLEAEIGRLDFEFQQPLPPPVVDHISTRLSALRAQQSGAKCAVSAKPGAKAAEGKAADAKPAPARKRPAPKVVEEESTDN